MSWGKCWHISCTTSWYTNQNHPNQPPQCPSFPIQPEESGNTNHRGKKPFSNIIDFQQSLQAGTKQIFVNASSAALTGGPLDKSSESLSYFDWEHARTEMYLEVMGRVLINKEAPSWKLSPCASRDMQCGDHMCTGELPHGTTRISTWCMKNNVSSLSKAGQQYCVFAGWKEAHCQKEKTENNFCLSRMQKRQLQNQHRPAIVAELTTMYEITWHIAYWS